MENIVDIDDNEVDNNTFVEPTEKTSSMRGSTYTEVKGTPQISQSEARLTADGYFATAPERLPDYSMKLWKSLDMLKIPDEVKLPKKLPPIIEITDSRELFFKGYELSSSKLLGRAMYHGGCLGEG